MWAVEVAEVEARLEKNRGRRFGLLVLLGWVGRRRLFALGLEVEEVRDLCLVKVALGDVATPLQAVEVAEAEGLRMVAQDLLIWEVVGERWVLLALSLV